MDNRKSIEDFLQVFNNFSEQEKGEVIKILMPKFCEIIMKDKSIIQRIMPDCMKMMKGMNFPMKDMMSNIMDKSW